MARSVAEALAPFVWGRGGAALTPEQLARIREAEAAKLAGGIDTSPVGHWTQGLARVADAAAGAFRRGQLESAQSENDSYNADVVRGLLGLGSGGASSAEAAADLPMPGAASEMSSTSPAPVDISGDRQTFVDSLLPAAIEEGKRTGVDPRIIVAQAAQETGWGRSAPGNNFFGIKSHGQAGGNSLMTTEVVNGQPVRERASFRTYGSPAESVRGYGDFITQNPRYEAFRAAKGLDAQLEALQASGYATDPNYSRSVGAIARGIQLPNEVAAATPQAAMEAAMPASGYVDPMVSVQPQAPALPEPTEVAAPPAVAAQPQQMAQAPSANEQIVRQLYGTLSDPRANESTRSVAKVLLQQEMAKQQAAADRAAKLADKQMEWDREDSRNAVLDRRYDAEQAYKRDQDMVTSDIKEFNFSQQNPGFADYQRDMRRAGSTNVTVGGGENRQVFDAVAASAESARAAATGLNALSEARKAVEGGIISGAGADTRLGLQRVGALLGVADPEIIQNTETFRSAIAPQVAAMMKATVGSTQISNADREFAQQAAGGSINLNEGTIKRLLGIMEKAGSAAVQSHMDRLNRVYPDGQGFDRERALFGVDMPMITEPAPAKPITDMSDEELRAIIDGR